MSISHQWAYSAWVYHGCRWTQFYIQTLLESGNECVKKDANCTLCIRSAAVIFDRAKGEILKIETEKNLRSSSPDDEQSFHICARRVCRAFMEARRPRGCLWPRRARAASWPNLFETIKIFSFWPEASVFTKASPFRFLFDPLLILFVRQMVNIFLPSSRKILKVRILPMSSALRATVLKKSASAASVIALASATSS